MRLSTTFFGTVLLLLGGTAIARGLGAELDLRYLLVILLIGFALMLITGAILPRNNVEEETLSGNPEAKPSDSSQPDSAPSAFNSNESEYSINSAEYINDEELTTEIENATFADTEKTEVILEETKNYPVTK